ncbi:MAG: peptidoglycan-binding protein [Ilumatobacteraceae bacterium]|jgi:peptidoglycan hydrolase-like protein with peptidoglycan-binding domain
MADEPDLAEGAEGEWVTYLQGWLQQLGFYHGAVDGEFGPVTKEAVANAQSRYQLQGDGAVDADTWKLLELARGENAEVNVAWGDSQVDTVDVPEMDADDDGEATA